MNNDLQISKSLSRRQTSGKDTTETVDGDNVVKTSKSLGTSGDRTGYSWRPVGSAAGLIKRQGNEDNAVVDGSNVVTVSKSQGTTNDRVGYSWRSTGL